MALIRTRLLIIVLLLTPGPLAAQEEASSSYYRYRDYEVSRSYYEDYEVAPGRGGAVLQREMLPGRGIHYTQAIQNRAWFRNFLADAHWNIPFYEKKTCSSCHPSQMRDIHTVRLGISCRQCHGGEPIASIDHYFSRLNPIRRHAYVCSKCHPEATASFATYNVHEPSPADPQTARNFPALFWVFWIMIGIFILTFVVFLPLTLLWVIRDFFAARRRVQPEQEAA